MPYNVRDFGAVGNGIADDTTAINTAIAQAINGDCQVYFPTGEYLYSQISLYNNITLYGDGSAKTFLKHSGNGSSLYNPNTGSIGRITIRDMGIKLADTTAVGIDFSRVFMSRIFGVEIIGGGDITIGYLSNDGVTNSAYYNSLYDVSINGVKFVDGNPIMGLGKGFVFQNSANSNRLINCRTNYVKTAVSIETDYNNHVFICGCAFENFETGVYNNGDFNQIIGNRFENGGSQANGKGIVITATSGNNFIAGNVMTNIATPVDNQNPNGTNLIHNYSLMSTKYIGHESNGGWNTNMSMRGYGIQNAGYVELKNPFGTNVKLQYGDFGQGEGLYIQKPTGWVKIV